MSVAGGCVRFALRGGFGLIAVPLMIMAALLLLSQTAQAQCASGPPANDCFANAIVIGPSPATTPATNTAGATTEPGEPAPCGGGATIWYSWTPTVAGTAQVDTYGSGFDTVLAAYTGSSLTALTNVGCNDDNPFPESMFTFTCVAGTTYLIQAGGFGTPGATGNMVVNISGCTNAPVCMPGTQTVPPGPASFTAGGAGPFNWSAPGGTPNSGTGPAFTTNYATAGVYTVTLTNSLGSSTCTVNVVVPGCGYTVVPLATYNFTDISLTGTGLPHGDDTAIVTPLPPGFSFTLCGTSSTDITTSSNGYVCVGNNGNCWWYPGQPIPTFGGGPGAAVYGYWADLYPPGCTGGATSCAFWEVQGTAPNRVYIYMQKDTPFCCSTTPLPVSYEIKLFEDTNCVEVHYLDVSDPGGFATTSSGYEDAGATVGYQFAYQSPGFAQLATAWSACPVPPFRAEDDSFTFIEDQTGHAFNVTANDINGPALPFTITSYTAPTLGTLSGPVGGEFTYTPSADAAGQDSFDYTITNTAGRNSTATVTIDINPVNDPPLFTGSTASILTSPHNGMYVSPGWATNVAAGPGTAIDESTQLVTFFVVSNSNPAIFDGTPTLERALTASGTTPSVPPSAGSYALLRFAPSGVGGISTVCFLARDNGANLTVTDGFTPSQSATGDDTSDPPQCVEIRENSAPSAYLEPSTTSTTPGRAVAFDSCPEATPLCSYDPDGTIVSYTWDFGDGYTSDLASTAHVFAIPGVYKVVLTVVDNWGSASSFLRLVTVAWQEDPPAQEQDASAGGVLAPIADAGEDRTAPEATIVQLSGAQKGASDAATYQWEQVVGIPVTLDNANFRHPVFTAPHLPGGVPVDLMFSLRVTEGPLTSAPDYVVIHVVTDNQLPLAEAGDPVTTTAGALVTLDGSGSSDPDQDPLSFEWTQVAGPHVELAGTDAVRTFTAPDTAQALVFRLKVNDGRGAAIDDVRVLVHPRLAQASPRFTYVVTPSAGGGDVRFEALEAEGAIWEFGDGATGSGVTTVHHYAPGQYRVTMRGADGQSTTQVVAVEGLGAEPGVTASVGPWAVLVAIGAFAASAAGCVYLVRRRP